MSRFPFEEDRRHRFGEFQEWVGRYIFIGRVACSGSAMPRERAQELRQPQLRRRRYRLSAAGSAASPSRDRAEEVERYPA